VAQVAQASQIQSPALLCYEQVVEVVVAIIQATLARVVLVVVEVVAMLQQNLIHTQDINSQLALDQVQDNMLLAVVEAVVVIMAQTHMALQVGAARALLLYVIKG
jgi:uncharacterized membrane protein YjgN (DUF898 family)